MILLILPINNKLSINFNNNVKKVRTFLFHVWNLAIKYDISLFLLRLIQNLYAFEHQVIAHNA